MARHPHADLIKEWVEDTSRAVQYFWDKKWIDVFIPDFDPDYEWRFKLEKKPDVVRYCMLSDSCGDGKQYRYHNAKLTFDGETGKLIKAEVIE